MVLYSSQASVPSAFVNMAAPCPSPPAPLITLPWLLALLRSVDLPAVINEGLWSCVPIPGDSYFKDKTMEQSFCSAVLKAGVRDSQPVKQLQRGLSYWDVFPLNYFSWLI